MFLMVGFSTEALEEALKTIDYLSQWEEICFPYLNVLNAFPSTEIYDNMIAQGATEEEIKGNFSMGYNGKKLRPRPRDEIIELVKVAFLKNYFLRRERLKKAINIQRKFLRDDELL